MRDQKPTHRIRENICSTHLWEKIHAEKWLLSRLYKELYKPVRKGTTQRKNEQKTWHISKWQNKKQKPKPMKRWSTLLSPEKYKLKLYEILLQIIRFKNQIRVLVRIWNEDSHICWWECKLVLLWKLVESSKDEWIYAYPVTQQLWDEKGWMSLL